MVVLLTLDGREVVLCWMLDGKLSRQLSRKLSRQLGRQLGRQL